MPTNNDTAEGPELRSVQQRIEAGERALKALEPALAAGRRMADIAATLAQQAQQAKAMTNPAEPSTGPEQNYAVPEAQKDARDPFDAAVAATKDAVSEFDLKIAKAEKLIEQTKELTQKKSE